jgi:lipoprotein-releasing system permease protein
MSLADRLSFETLLGWRYTRAGRAARRNGFISFISGASMLGIALGVAALIVVLSVMNGFRKDVPTACSASSPTSRCSPRRRRAARAGADPGRGAQEPAGGRRRALRGCAGLLARGEAMQGVMVRGIDPALEPQVTEVAAQIKDTLLPRLTPGSFGILLGNDLARKLGVTTGDTVTLIAPSGQVTPAGVVPRLKQMTVVGTFSSGHYEYDSALAMLNIEDAERIFRLEGPTGVRLKLRDLHQARRGRAAGGQPERQPADPRLDAPEPHLVCRRAAGKRMMFIILTLIVAVAAFNLVSTLVMTVTDKRADIAILRTLGASPPASWASSWCRARWWA